MKSASAKAVARLICRSRSRSPSSSRPSATFSGSARVCQTLAAAAEGEGVAPSKLNTGALSDILAAPGEKRPVKEGLGVAKLSPLLWAVLVFVAKPALADNVTYQQYSASSADWKRGKMGKG